MVPKTLNVRAVPKGVVLQVRNVLTNLVDIAGQADGAAGRAPAREGRRPGRAGEAGGDQATSCSHRTARPRRCARRSTRAATTCSQLLDEFPSCKLNIFEFLQVAQPLRPRYYSPSSSPRDPRRRRPPDGRPRGRRSRMRPAVPRDERALPAHAARRRPPERLPRERRRLPSAGGRDEADDLRLRRDRLRADARVPLGAPGAEARRRRARRRRRSSTASAPAASTTSTATRSSGSPTRACSTTCTSRPRASDGRREYVQDRLRAQGALVWRLLEAGAYVYVCGSQPMRDGVRAAFVDVVAEHGAMPREHAEAYLDELETTQNRYRPDLWG